MKTQLTERAYGGKKFRPNIHIYQEKENNLTLCITCWGSTDSLNRIVELIKNSIILYDETQDMEATAFLSEGSLRQNQPSKNLELALEKANKAVYEQFNNEEYTTGFEVFISIQSGPQWLYAVCGQPNVILHRKQMGIIPLTHNIDLNVLSLKDCVNDPLPHQILGLSPFPPSIHSGHLYPRSTDHLALISRSYLPKEFFCLSDDRFNEEEISLVLARDNKDIPFWLGFMKFI